MSDKFAALRIEYAQRGLNEAGAPADPLTLFHTWLDEAIAAGLEEPNAMTLATATPHGAPSARIVLLKQADAAGFTFFTNRLSRKGQDLAANPQAALVFFWQALARQVRVAGPVAELPAAASDAYFASRPFEAQVGAWASPQSTVLPHRAALEARFAEFSARYTGQAVPRPPHWGGYCVQPTTIEFWQGGQHRLHDRLLYHRQPTGWHITRLSP